MHVCRPSGSVDMIVNGKMVDSCQAGEALGFVSVIDGGPRTTTACVKEDAVLSAIDQRKFFFMVAEVPNFARYVMENMAGRVRGMRQAI